jgi:hypothetical protein
MQTALITEFSSQVDAWTDDDDARLLGLGVPPFARVNAVLCAVGCATIRAGGGKYRPDPEGFKAWTLVSGTFVNDSIEDLIAFSPDRPDKVYRRLGRATYLNPCAVQRRGLGISQVHKPRRLGVGSFTFSPLKIWRDPIAWLRGYCAGTVVLDWKEARIDLTALDCAIRAEDVAHGRQIRNMLQTLPGPTPEILVRAAA